MKERRTERKDSPSGAGPRAARTDEERDPAKFDLCCLLVDVNAQLW